MIVTADGKELPVRYIMGANDLYDVIKFKTGVNKKSATLDPAVQGGKTGEQIYLLPIPRRNLLKDKRVQSPK